MRLTTAEINALPDTSRIVILSGPVPPGYIDRRTVWRKNRRGSWRTDGERCYNVLASHELARCDIEVTE